MRTFFYAVVLFIVSWSCQRTSPPAEQVLFSAEADTTIACYRIPALAVAKNGALLAAIDQRVPSCGDLRSNRDINIVLRRSIDHGATWSKEGVVVNFPLGQSASDPSFMVDQQTGTVFLLYNFMDLDRAPNEYRFHLLRSDDHGVSWSDPVDITSQIKDPAWQNDFTFITSGHGIQTQEGTLLHTLVHLEQGVFLFGSTNGGRTWQRFGTPVQPADESKVVELPGGIWMINSRVNEVGYRVVHTSADRGVNWTTRSDSVLIDPGCNAALVYHPAGDRLYFVNAKHSFRRENLTLRHSKDRGHTWSRGEAIFPGSAAYASMVVLPTGELGILYERNDYTEHVFVRVNE